MFTQDPPPRSPRDLVIIRHAGTGNTIGCGETAHHTTSEKTRLRLYRKKNILFKLFYLKSLFIVRLWSIEC